MGIPENLKHLTPAHGNDRPRSPCISGQLTHQGWPSSAILCQVLADMGRYVQSLVLENIG